MKKLAPLLILALFARTSPAQVKHTEQPLAMYLGNFTDDYATRYTISDTLWLQLPRTRFHIIRWNAAQQYLIARNDMNNPGDGGLYTRIDLVPLTDMAPWKWGYCLTAYHAATDALAEATAAADRAHPKKGCNGFPFSRMKIRPEK